MTSFMTDRAARLWT